MLTNHLKIQQNIDLFWKISIFSFLAVVFIAMPGAGNASGGTSICGVLGSILSVLTGGPARLLATFAICFLGVAAFFGKLQWGTAMLVAVGIGLIFGAATLVNGFGTGGSVSTSC